LEALLEKITEWMKELLVSASVNSLTGLFDSVNDQVGQVAVEVGTSPASFQPGIFSMIQNLSETVIMPVAGIILTFVACYELIRLVTDNNNLANIDIWILFKWIFKTAIAAMIVSNTFNIVMAVFDLGQYVVSSSAGIIQGTTAIDASTIGDIKTELEAMELGPLLGLCIEVMLLSIALKILAAIIFVIVYGRMLEIYLMTSLAPIPMATLANREQSMVGQNFFRSILALAFQGFLMMVCIGIYALLIQSFSVSGDMLKDFWKVVGYTILLAFSLFKTGSLSKGILNAH
jgi:hypothetical protein